MRKKFFSLILITVMLIFIENLAQARNVEALTGTDSDFNSEYYYYTRVINCNEWISLRRFPSTSSERIAEIPLNATVVVFYDLIPLDAGDVFFHEVESNGFRPVIYRGMKGYCLTEYLEPHSDEGGPIRLKGRVAGVSNYLSIYELPNANSKEVLRIPNGTELSLINERVDDFTWWKVKVLGVKGVSYDKPNSEEIIGYVNAKYIEM